MIDMKLYQYFLIDQLRDVFLIIKKEILWYAGISVSVD